MRDRRLRFMFRWSLAAAVVLSGCGSAGGRLEASGTIEASSVTVSARLGGDVRVVAVREGARVKRGDPLAQINSIIPELERGQARAALVQAEDLHRTADEDFSRAKALFAAGSVTRKQYDDARSRSDVTRSQVDAARLAVALGDEQVGYARVTTPTDGVVTHRLVEPGELVFPGSALFTVTDLSRMHLTIYLSERDLARVKIGQAAEVKIDTFPDRTFPGVVVFISPEAEFTPKNVQSRDDRVKLVFAVKIDLSNPDEYLKPGVPADAVLLEVPGTKR